MLRIKVEGMTCGHCAMHVKKALADVAGATSVEVDLQAGEAVVEGSAQTEALLRAVEAEGYSARLA